MSDAANTTPPAAAMVRQGFGETTAMTGVELQSQALAAQVKAAVEARYILAMRRPRDINDVRVKLLKECQRPRFADEARYSVPRGRKQNERGEWVDNMVEGPSIRFAEAAVRCMTNVDTTTMIVYDDATSRTVRVTAIDLESNVTYSKDVTIAKTAEKRDLRKGQVAIGQRYTSAGHLVHIVAIPDSELQNVQAAAESKALRGLILRLVPGDITEECMDRCSEVQKDDHAKDPRLAIKNVCDGFGRLGVQPSELVTYLGHSLDQLTPAEYQHLKSLGIALRDGQVSWAEVMERKGGGDPVAVAAPAPASDGQAAPPAPGGPPASAPAPADKPKGVKAAISKAKAAAPAPAPAPAAPAKPVSTAAAAPATSGPPANVPPKSSPAPVQGDNAGTDKTGDLWQETRERVAAKAAPAVAPAPEPEPEVDPHGDPPPPDDVELPGASEHATGDAPDWMR